MESKATKTLHFANAPGCWTHDEDSYKFANISHGSRQCFNFDDLTCLREGNGQRPLDGDVPFSPYPIKTDDLPGLGSRLPAPRRMDPEGRCSRQVDEPPHSEPQHSTWRRRMLLNPWSGEHHQALLGRGRHGQFSRRSL